MKLHLLIASVVATVASVVGLSFFLHSSGAVATPASEPPERIPVSVATVEARDVRTWSEFSGRMEAVERVEVRSRVAGAVQAVHFNEGALVESGDLLVTIDPAPYAADVARARAQLAAAQARLTYARSERARAQRLYQERAIAERELDERANAEREAGANAQAAQAQLQIAELDLGYTRVRAPVSGRVGRIEVTVGNLVAAGPGAPVLTTLVSVDPIYASFEAEESLIERVLRDLPEADRAHGQVSGIPVEIMAGSGTRAGQLQLVDNQVDARSGTVRVRAVFANADGALKPGQFARLRMGKAAPESALLVNERAVGTDQSKKYVWVVDAADTVSYREVALGESIDGLRIVTSGLASGERVVVNGLQRVKSGTLVLAQPVPMSQKSEVLAALQR